MLARILAVFFALWLWPGTGELAEYAVHWVQDGDAVHGARHHEPAPGDDDGCPGPAHLCHLASCGCTSTTTPQLVTITVPPIRPTAVAAPARATSLASCDDPAPPHRPPIA